jgi:hypothetical protein
MKFDGPALQWLAMVFIAGQLGTGQLISLWEAQPTIPLKYRLNHWAGEREVSSFIPDLSHES